MIYQSNAHCAWQVENLNDYPIEEDYLTSSTKLRSEQW